jgi:hypothetical protein
MERELPPWEYEWPYMSCASDGWMEGRSFAMEEPGKLLRG